MACELFEFKAGIYRHLKGDLYDALFLTHDSNNKPAADDKPPQVIYTSLTLVLEHEGLRRHNRSLVEWSEYICLNLNCRWYGQPVTKVYKRGVVRKHVGDPNVPGIWPHLLQRRFTYLGPGFEGWMLEPTWWVRPTRWALDRLSNPVAD